MIKSNGEAIKMDYKADILLHPVRMKIVRTLMGHSKEGLTPLEMAKIIQDVSQATLYRHIQKLADANIIRVLREEKVRAVTEKYYIVNMEETNLDSEEWESYSADDKLRYYSYYQLSLFSQYQTYLNRIEKENTNDLSTLSVIDLNLDDPTFKEFQNELNDLMMKYYKKSHNNSKKEAAMRTLGITIIP